MAATAQQAVRVIKATPRQVKDRFAALGYLALWGGRKGSGFWIYKTTTGKVAEYGELNGWCPIPGECIENDGVASGNPSFWMMDDAVALLERLEGEA